MEYNVRVEYRLDSTAELDEQLVSALEGFSPAAAPAVNGNAEVWITIQAANLNQAVDVGLALAGKASTAELNAIEVLPTEDFDHRNGITPVPALVGAEEAAEMLGITRQAVGQKFAAGQLPGHRVGERVIVFARSDIEQAAAARGR
jgi:excisionase family DNA binding protein